MHFAFSEEQIAIQESVRQLLSARCTTEQVQAAWSSETGRVPGLWSLLVEQGVVGLLAPEAAGGMGLGPEELVLVLEEAGRAGAPEPLIEHVAVAVPLLSWLVEQGVAPAEPLLEQAASGEALVAVGLEPGAPVAYARSASALLLRQGDELHLLRPDQVTLTDEVSVDRTRRLCTVGWAPSAETCVAQGEQGRALLERALQLGAFASGAFLAGLAARMIDLGVEYAKVRKQFGQPIGSFQAVQHRIVNAYLKLEMARPVIYGAAWHLAEQTDEVAVRTSMARIYGVEAALAAAREILQIHGAIGYTTEYELHLWMKRAWSLASSWGSVREHEQVVERALLDT